MKRLILIMLTVLATTAVAYRLPTAWTLGGGLSYDSVRVTAYRAETGSATLTNEVDTSFVGAGTDGSFALFVDSLAQYTVRYMYFSGSDTFREYSYGNMPTDYERFARVKLQETSDSLAGQSWATAGSLTAAQQDSLFAANERLNVILDSLAAQAWAATGGLSSAEQDSLFAANARLNTIIDSLAGQTWAATGTSSSGGCPDSVGDAVTLVAYDSVAGAPIQSAQMALRSSVNGANLAVSPLTGASGAFTFTIASPGTYYVVTRANSVTFPVRTLTVTGAQTDTVNGGGFVVVAAAAPDEASVYGTVDCYYCDVRFTLMSANQSVTDTSTGYLVSETVKDTTTNSAGQFSMPLKKTGNMLYTSGTSRKHPIWNVRISPTDVEKEVRWFKDFEIPSDSTSLHIGEVR